MDGLVKIIIFAVFIESVVEIVKEVRAWPQVVAIILGIAGTLIYGFGALAAVGIAPSIGAGVYFDQILTGAVVGRGAKAVHDLVQRINGARPKPVTG